MGLLTYKRLLGRYRTSNNVSRFWWDGAPEFADIRSKPGSLTPAFEGRNSLAKGIEKQKCSKAPNENASVECKGKNGCGDLKG
jgi:hypothetical protein